MRFLLIGLLIGAVLGGAAGFFAFPFLSTVERGSGAVEQGAGAEILAAGHFTHADPADRIHYGRGAVTIYGDRVALGGDFEVGPGPRYHVYLVPERGIDPDTRVEETMFVDLGPLRAFRGPQDYPLPAGLDLQDFGSVVIWCEQFNTLISAAELTAGAQPDLSAAEGE